MSKRHKKFFHIFLCIISFLIIIELCFQALAFFGKLPGINTYKHVPYGRVYWTKEGRGNGLMNRFGWHYPPVQTTNEGKTIALIGDSFIEALQIDPHRHLGQTLQTSLNIEKTAPSYTVLAFGLSGAGPAHYLEMMKYTYDFFKPDEIILFIFLGNDFVNASVARQGHAVPASKYIYYIPDRNKNLILHPDSQRTLNDFRKKLYDNHRPVWIYSPSIAYSHWLSLHVVHTLVHRVQGLYQRRSVDKPPSDRDMPDEPGIDASEQSVLDASPIIKGLLSSCRTFAEHHDIQLKLVSIPYFPPDFFANEENRMLSQQAYKQYLQSETVLTQIARDLDINILPMGKHMVRHSLKNNDIRSLYYRNGQGHLTVAGHTLFADALKNTFYPDSP